jgi:hypothetical protein
MTRAFTCTLFATCSLDEDEGEGTGDDGKRRGGEEWSCERPSSSSSALNRPPTTGMTSLYISSSYGSKPSSVVSAARMPPFEGVPCSKKKARACSKSHPWGFQLTNDTRLINYDKNTTLYKKRRRRYIWQKKKIMSKQILQDETKDTCHF